MGFELGVPSEWQAHEPIAPVSWCQCPEDQKEILDDLRHGSAAFQQEDTSRVSACREVLAEVVRHRAAVQRDQHHVGLLAPG